MNNISVKLLLCVLLCSNVAFAAVTDTAYRAMKDSNSFKNKLKAYSSGLSTIESNFVQKKYMSIFIEPVNSQGYFCFKNGLMIRWEYNSPFQYLIIINNGRMFIKDENRKNSYDLTASESFQKLNTILGNILQGDVLNDKNDFSCSYFENDLNYKLVLAPKSKDIKVFFKEIVLYFGKDLFSVSRVTLNEVSGDKTDIWFNDRKINIDIPDEKFIIK